MGHACAARLLAAGLAGALLAASAAAQVTTALVQGRVLDGSGAAVAGATIKARNVDTAAERTGPSDAKGAYRLAALPPGRYEVTAALAGFVTATRSGVVLTIGQEANLDFTLGVSPRQETVTIEGQAPIVETTKSDLSTTFTTRQIDDLAVSERTFTNLAFLAPGILDGPSNENSRVTVVAGGGNGTTNTFLIDGLSNDADSVSDTRGQFALDAIGQFQVISSQFDAEFGQASGAIVNVITRSGTNQLKGRAYGYYRADELSANDPFVQPDPASGEKNKAPFSQKIFGATLAGPLKKDKTFFFLSYDHTFRDASTVVSVDPAILTSLGLDTQGTYENPIRNPLVLAKLDHHPTPDQTLTLRYRLDRRTETNAAISSNFASDSFFDRLEKSYDIAVSHTWIVSPRVVNDARFQFARSVNDLADQCAGCPFIVRPSVSSGKFPSFPQNFTEDRLQFLDTLSFAVPNKGGDHYFKAGADVSFLGIEGMVPQTRDGLFVFQTDSPFNAADPTTYPFLYQISVGDPSFDVPNNLYTFFVQDQWRVSRRLTLNLGLRYDFEDHVAVKSDKNNVAPRLHLAWDPDGKGQTSIRGGFGIYYDQVFLNVPLFAVLLDGTLETTTLLLPGYPDPFVGGLGVPVPNPPPTVYRFQAGGLDTPSNRTLSLGVKRELLHDLALSVDFVQARGRNLLVRIDENYSVGGSPRADSNFNQILTIESRGRSNYKAVQVGVEKRYSNKYAFGLAYTLSDSKRNTEGHQFSPVDGRRIEDEYGPSSNDARHTFAGNMNLDLPFGFKLGASGRFRSGVPFDTITGTDDNQDLVTNDRPAGVPRNSRREGSNWTVDARLTRVFRTGRVSVEPVVEAFNVLNHPSRGFYENNLLSPNYGNPTQTIVGFRPRQLQLGVRLDF